MLYVLIIVSSISYISFLHLSKKDKCESLYKYYLEHKSEEVSNKNKKLVDYWTNWYKRNCS